MIVAGRYTSLDLRPQKTSRLISVRNSDTTASTLVSLFYRLAKHPEHMHKVQKELDAAGDLEDIKTLQKLPHLTGTIKETLRLHPAVPTGGLRETPPEGATVCGHFVPGNTAICAPRYTIHRRKSIPKNCIIGYSNR